MNPTLTHAEEKLAELIWETAPVGSGKLTELAQKRFGWKRTTTFTVLKRLIEKGLAENSTATVAMLVTRQELVSAQSRHFVNGAFSGSLPKFITAFIGNRKLSPEQAAEIKKIIEQHEEE